MEDAVGYLWSYPIRKFLWFGVTVVFCLIRLYPVGMVPNPMGEGYDSFVSFSPRIHDRLGQSLVQRTRQ